jgi:hypothetical protein
MLAIDAARSDCQSVLSFGAMGAEVAALDTWATDKEILPDRCRAKWKLKV